jgi:hypothetical protein
MAAPTLRARRKILARTGKSAPRRNRRQPRTWWLVWWPLALGVAVTPFTLHAADVFALSGPRALLFLYPYVQLFKWPGLRLSAELGNQLSQLMMYLQFPLYGLLMALVLRARGIGAAILAVLLAHFVVVLMLYFVPAMGHATP